MEEEEDKKGKLEEKENSKQEKNREKQDIKQEEEVDNAKKEKKRKRLSFTLTSKKNEISQKLWANDDEDCENLGNRTMKKYKRKPKIDYAMVNAVLAKYATKKIDPLVAAITGEVQRKKNKPLGRSIHICIRVLPINAKPAVVYPPKSKSLQLMRALNKLAVATGVTSLTVLVDSLESPQDIWVDMIKDLSSIPDLNEEVIGYITALALSLNIQDPYVSGAGRKFLKQALKVLKTKNSTFRKEPERFHFLIDFLTSLIMKLDKKGLLFQ